MIKRLLGRDGVSQRKRIRERDNYTCRICSIAVNRGEIDHILSLEDNGTNDDNNLQLLCVPCHKEKTAKDRNYIRRYGVDDNGLPVDKLHHWNI